MFDARLRPLIDPPLNRMAAWIAARGISANALTVIGFVIGLAAVPALAAGLYWVAFFLIGFNRLADGLDGPVARARPEGSSEVGGFLDITLDFLFYGAIVVGFALADPARNALPAAVLLFCFIGTGSSFLAFAIIAAKHDLTTEAQGKKGIY
ncbi:MAG: CDP-alcohol phosphatidyltransferase family protein, partial [Rhodospirillaceae bacterium]